MKTRVFPRLLWIRLMQIWRWMGEIGLFRIIFVWCVIVPFGFLFLWQKMGGQPYNWGILSVSAVLFLLLHRKRKDFLFLYKQVSRPQWLYLGNIVSIHALSSAACFFMKSILLCCVIYWFYWVLLLFRHCQQRFVHTLFFFVLCRLLVLNGVAVSGRMCCHFGCVFF